MKGWTLRVPYFAIYTITPKTFSFVSILVFVIFIFFYGDPPNYVSMKPYKNLNLFLFMTVTDCEWSCQLKKYPQPKS